jgi:hypothetical protein
MDIYIILTVIIVLVYLSIQKDIVEIVYETFIDQKDEDGYSCLAKAFTPDNASFETNEEKQYSKYKTDRNLFFMDFMYLNTVYFVPKGLDIPTWNNNYTSKKTPYGTFCSIVPGTTYPSDPCYVPSVDSSKL